MKNIRAALQDIPTVDTVRVEYLGVSFIADELAVRHIQLKVFNGEIAPENITVYDIDKQGNEYPMIWREDGKFKNDFTCKLFSANSEATLDLLCGIKKKASN